MRKRLDFSTSSATIGSMWVDYEDKNLNLRPSYQRGYVWSNDFKNKLIYSVVKNYPIGNITLRKLANRENIKYKSEVVDGQQRLTTIFDFIDNKHSIAGEDAQNIIEEVIGLYSDDELKNNSEKKRMISKYEKGGKIHALTYSMLPERAKIQVNNYNVAVATINQADDNEVAEYFRFVQNQERLRAGEIITAFVDSPLDQYLNSNCDVQKLSDVIQLDNSRRDINKMYYGILGLLEGKLNLGCKDDNVIEFVRSVDTKKMTETLKSNSEKLVRQLNFIASSSDKPLVNSNKRMFKFILLLIGFDLINFETDAPRKLKIIEIFNNNLSSFNSAKKDEIENVFSNKFDEESKENHRLVALIAKGGHNKKRVQERVALMMNILKNDYDL